MQFPNSISLKWNSKKSWNINYSFKSDINDESYLNFVTLRNIKKEIKIYGKIQQNVTNIGNRHILEKTLKNKSLLKSNLQKCIRRSYVDEALISAFNLINVDFLAFIRRIIIIAIEDVGIPSNLDFLVWLMIAYPNYEINNEIIQYLLLTVYSLCIYGYKKTERKNDTFIVNYNEVIDYYSLDFNNNFINSLIIRSAFGGMKGDIKMINKLINMINDGCNIDIIPISTKNIYITRSILKSDIIYCSKYYNFPSIDFHCYPEILDLVHQETGIPKLRIKNLMWYFSSCRNKRVNGKKKDYLYPFIDSWQCLNCGKIHDKRRCYYCKLSKKNGNFSKWDYSHSPSDKKKAFYEWEKIIVPKLVSIQKNIIKNKVYIT